MTPVSTSPEPPLAMAGEPLKFINSFPSFLAVTVAASFKTQVTPYWSENSLAAAKVLQWC